MLAIFDDDKNRLAHTFNGLTLNNPADDKDDSFELNSAVPLTQLDSISDPHQSRDGTEAYEVRKVARIYRVEGVIRAPSLAKLFDKMALLGKTFDPAKLSHEDPTNLGFLAYDFDVPTLDTANYASGFVPSRYYFRPRAMPEPIVSEYTGNAAEFHLELIARDPRRYWQTQSSVTAAGTLDNSLAEYRSWPTLTLNMGGAGSATANITNTTDLGTATITLDLSGCVNSDVVVIDFEARTITKNGVATPSLKVAGSFVFEIEPDTQTIAVTNFTNVSSWSLAWRRAFCL